MSDLNNGIPEIIDILKNDNLDRYHSGHASWVGRQLKLQAGDYITDSKWFVFKNVALLDANEKTINDGIKYSLGSGRPKHSAVRLSSSGQGGGVFRELELTENQKYTFIWYDTLDKYKGIANKKDYYMVTISGSVSVREYYSAIQDIWLERSMHYTPSRSGKHVVSFSGGDSIGSYKRGCVISNISCKTQVKSVKYDVKNITKKLELMYLQGNTWMQMEDWVFSVHLNELISDGVICRFELSPEATLYFSSGESKYLVTTHNEYIIIPAGTIFSNSITDLARLIIVISGQTYYFNINYKPS